MLTMSRSDVLAQTAISIAEDNDLTPHFGYSGRYMYGRTCFGLVGNIAQINSFIITLVQNLMEDSHNDHNEVNEEFIDSFRLMAVDSMGLDSIMYFTELDIKNDMDTEAEENDEEALTN
jgi:hypothetical protein